MILLIDDDDSVTVSLALLLKQAGYASASASTPQKALELLERRDFSLVLQDMNFTRKTTGEEGLELLRLIKERRPEVPVVLITAWGSIALAVEGMKAGASDFITKPWRNDQILQVVRTALGLSGAAREPAGSLSREDLDARYDFDGIVGRDPKLLRVLEIAGRVAPTDASVLITGASGTGKEGLAEAIHRNNPRRGGPFVKVNLGGISQALFDSEMFGHVRGAFTDALRDRKGRFPMAEGGTIFLDEIGDLDPSSQVKMLRVLQDRTYEVLGSSEAKTLDIRVISATNRNLEAAIEEGRFREDLFYRLNLIALHLPSLDERPGDVPLLVNHFLAQARAAHGRPSVLVDDAARSWLRSRGWPGNVRELKHLIERAVLVTDRDVIRAEDLDRISRVAAGDRDPLPPVGSMTMDEIERAMIRKSLEFYDGNISRAAESLGLSRPAFYRRLEKHGIPT